MYLFLHLIINMDRLCATNYCLEDTNPSHCRLKEIGYIMTDREFEIVDKNIIEIGADEELQEEKLIALLDGINMIIIFESNVTLSILKKYLLKRNMNKVIDAFNTKCFYEIRSNIKSVVKKVNRYGILYPTINDLSMFTDQSEYIDSDSSENALNVIHTCCLKLYKENNLKNFDITIKKHEEKSFSKSFIKILSFQTLGKTLFSN